jgi:Domain of unknown function (DUF6378)
MGDEKRYTLREEILREAIDLTTTKRNASYGEPDDHFKEIISMANALGFRIDVGDGTIRELTSADHVRYMTLVKLSRLSRDPAHRDSWTDIAGYAACGFETAELTRRRAEEFRAQEYPPEVSRVEVIEGWIDHPEIRAVGRLAANGDCDQLERRGLMLIEGPGSCGPDCDPELGSEYSVEHQFRDSCKYRIRKRRADA